jgi:PAS domain S-box-containing protein
MTSFAVVVNDDPTQLNLLCGLVRKAGLEPRAFTGAEAALAAMSAGAGTADGDPGAVPALVVTDLYMPGIDGWRFCCLLRSLEYAALNHVPILLVSATYAGEESDRIAADLGAEAFLPSPVDGQRFVEQVRTILKGGQVRQPPRALIVDDDESLAGILEKAFAAHGYQAETALTARAAADAFKTAAYDVAVLDYHLPDGTGDALLDAFRAERPDCVCIMMTTDPGPELALDWMKRGAAAYLHKPFQPDYLIELCARARRERALLRVQDLLELRTRELRHQSAIIAETSDAIITTKNDEDFTITTWNPGAEQIYGWTKKEVLGRSSMFLQNEYPGQDPKETLEKILHTGLYDGEVIQSRKDGTRVIVDARLVARKDNKGETTDWICVNRDITERKRAEEALRESEERHRHLFESMEQGVAYQAADGTIVSANPAAERILGITLDQMMGRVSTDLRWRSLREDGSDFPGEEHPAMLALRSGRPVLGTMMGVFHPVENQYRWILVDAVPAFRPGDATPFQVYTTFSDITERKRAVEMVRESQREIAEALEFNRSILRTSSIGILVYRQSGQCTFANEAVAKTVGTDVAGLLAQDFHRIQSWKDSGLYDTARKALATDTEQQVEAPLVTTFGRDVWLNLRFSTLSSGGEKHLLVFAYDVTERKRAEAALRESEERYRTLVESTLDGIVIHVGDRVALANRAAAAMLDFAGPAALVGQPLESFVHPDDLASVRDRVRRVQAGEAVAYPVEVRYVKRDGTELPVENTGALVTYEGKPAVLAVIRDITERKQAEKMLRESEQRYRRLFEAESDAIFLVDCETGCFVANNPSAERMYGYSRDGFLGLRADDVSAEPEKPRQAIAAEEAHVSLRLHRRKDGTVFPVEISGSYFDDQGRRIHLAAIRDITERKRAEEEKAGLEAQLQQAQKMESVGRLAGGVAHDFNNMLGVILGHADMALEQVDPAQPLHADLTEIRKAAIRSADLTRQLLAFARKQTIAPRVLDLNETVAGVLKMLRRLIGEDIRLTWQPGADLWPVNMDPSQIDQILANVCVNARDAIADVGTITIETANSAIDEDYCAAHAGFVPGDYVRLVVSDDGCGMDQDTQAHVFEPFFTTKGVGEGTGLGLATVYGAVKQNHGFISVHSEPGAGTTLTIYLPRHVGKAEQLRTAGAAGPLVPGHETILLVEDEPAILNLATLVLERQGYTVLAATTPGEAIRLAREHAGQIHLLMTDVVMPEMNGRDLARNLLPLYPHLKRLFMSGYTADVVAHHGVLDDGVSFLQKPFSVKGMAAKVREVLDRR